MTVPYSQCVSSYTIDSTIIVTSTTVDTSVSVSLAGLSPGVYTVKVASVDYVNRTGSYSKVLSFELQGLTKYHWMPSDYHVSFTVFVLIVPPTPVIQLLQSDTHGFTLSANSISMIVRKL